MSVSYESEWTIPSPIPGYYAGFNQGFRWTTAVPGVVGGIYQDLHAAFSAGRNMEGGRPRWSSASCLPPKAVITKGL